MTDINIGILAENQNLSEFEITENFSCVRFLDQNKERFELEFNLEKGTSFNTFFIRSNEELFIIHPPEKQYLDSFNKVISRFCDQFNLGKINFISGHINPQIIETIKSISTQFQNTTITCSNPGYKLISELWNQRNPTLENFIEIQLPEIKIIKKELNLELDNISLELIPIPTARWPGGLIIYERNQEILLSEKIFSAHIASKYWSETNRVSTEIDRKHFYDCLMAPMSNQVVSITEKIADYDIKTIAPLHGPAFEYSLKSFLNDYIRWGHNLSKNQKIIFDLIDKSGGPMKAYSILFNVQKKGIKAPLQVYRALDKLVEIGKIHKIESRNAFIACQNSSCQVSKATAFSICESCENVSEISNSKLSKYLSNFSDDSGMKYSKYNLEFFGLCKKCKSK